MVEVFLRDRRGLIRAVSLIDDEDAVLVESRWHLTHGYARRAGGVLLHRAVAERMGIGNAEMIDHISRDRLDNRRVNLRASNALENARNRSSTRTGPSARFTSEAERAAAAQRVRRYRERHKKRLTQERTALDTRANVRRILAITRAPRCADCDTDRIRPLVVVDDEILCRNCAFEREVGSAVGHGHGLIGFTRLG